MNARLPFAAILAAGIATSVYVTSQPKICPGNSCHRTTTTTVPTATTVPTTTIPVTTTVPVTTTIPPSPTYLFDDEFNGTAGSAPDSTKWVNKDGTNYGGMSYSKAANATLNGSGQLDLRITRGAWFGKSYAGASIGTYDYGTGWPPSGVRASWSVPFTYEVRFLLPNVNGAWIGPGWNQNVDRTTSQSIYELDNGETITNTPTWFGANQHTWLNGADTAAATGGGGGSDGRFNWHTMTVHATSAGVFYSLDGVLVSTHYGASGRFGVQIHSEVADPGTWAGGTQPSSSDSGPWDALIDYVRVTAG